MEFHISRYVREQVDLDDLLFSFSGNVIFANVTASRRLAERLNAVGGPNNASQKTIHGAALFAMGLIDELSHALVASYRKETDPLVLSDALRFLSDRMGSEQLDKLLLEFTEQFPNVAIYRNEITAQQWLSGRTESASNQEAALEELILLWLANTNPAFTPFRVLFDDQSLKNTTAYIAAAAILPDYFKTRPPVEAGSGTLLETLKAPMLASPDSLTGQLDYIREHWSPIIGNDLIRVLLAIDVLREEEIAIWMQFHPAGPVWHRHGDPGRSSEGFVGDEFVGFEQTGGSSREAAGALRRYADDYQAPLNEYEAFSADQAWMPTVVLIAKNTYVWLEQLSKKYGRHIHRLDQIPDEELRLLADRGITGLWLIGLWERSSASKTIKRLRGNPDAVASAYSLKNYTIAQDLGGDAAYLHLKEHALLAGLRLASDMVPNHMGIDSDWVIQHPDWFLSRSESPFPVYRFDGPDVSNDPRVEIKIEDHYYDHSDAAVVFRLRHHADGATRFVYHGNDGTTFAWNDTAQLDYSKSAVRESVIQVILEVARRFPIIRFDAAMVLAKRHVQRLWFPLPGTGGSIPSRAENAITEEAFNALMPHEFWREVVDRVAAEVPGTLLLAEAFWLLEGYFVRTLGMHRVYNSAFMNMLRDEENAKYRSYLKKTVEFDPDILKRYVNFMSNPDERTAIDQFGSGDKYFGVSVLLATLPGLPMFGHGQIEGFTERYGMDFKQALLDEFPNDDLVVRHQHLIAPLLKSRHLFAESQHFLLYDFWNDQGAVDENVFAYSNRHGNERALILYNNSYQSTHGTIHFSVGFLDKFTGSLQQRSLALGLNLPHDNSALVAYKDNVVGLEYIRYANDLRDHGLTLYLRGYQHVALLKWRELQPTASQPWDRLCDALHGSGVYSLEDSLSKLQIRPLLEMLREAVSTVNIQSFATLSQRVDPVTPEKTKPIPAADSDTTPTPLASPPKAADREGQTLSSADRATIHEQLSDFISHAHSFNDRMQELLAADGSISLPKVQASAPEENQSKAAASIQTPFLDLTEASLKLPSLITAIPADLLAAASAVLPASSAKLPLSQTWAPVLAWLVFQTLPVNVEPFEVFERFNLRWALAETFSSVGLEGEAVWKAAAQIRTLLKYSGKSPEQVVQTEEFWADPDVRWLIGVNNSGGIEYVNQERHEEILFWLQLPQLLRSATSSKPLSKPVPVTSLVTQYSNLLRQAKFQYQEFLRLLLRPEKESEMPVIANPATLVPREPQPD
jgi:glycosidase